MRATTPVCVIVFVVVVAFVSVFRPITPTATNNNNNVLNPSSVLLTPIVAESSSSSSSKSPTSASSIPSEQHRFIPDPAVALRIALEDSLSNNSSPSVLLSDADAERCIWNDGVLQRCASQWTKRALRHVADRFNVSSSVPASLVTVEGAECESFFAAANLTKFALNGNGVASRYSFEFFGDSMTRGLFAEFVHSFDESAVPENKKQGFYLNRGPLFPPPILLPRAAAAAGQLLPPSHRWRKQGQISTSDSNDEIDLISDALSSPRRNFLVYPQIFEPLHDPVFLSINGTENKSVIISVTHNNSIQERCSTKSFRRGLARDVSDLVLKYGRSPSTSDATSAHSLRSSAAASAATLRVMFRTDGGTAGNTSPRRDAIVKTAIAAFQNVAYSPPASSFKFFTSIPPNMWRGELLKAFADAKQQEDGEDGGGGSVRGSSAKSSSSSNFMKDIFNFPDIVTNSDAPKILIHTNVHPELGLGRSVCESLRDHRPIGSYACGAADFLECLSPLPAEKQRPRWKKASKGRPGSWVMPSFFLPRKVSAGGGGGGVSNEFRMRNATKFGFSNSVEEERITEFLDAHWRYTLLLSARRNVHLFVRLEILQDCEIIRDSSRARSPFRTFYAPVCFALLIRQHQGTRLRKLVRYELMRAAGLLHSQRGKRKKEKEGEQHPHDESLLAGEEEQKQFFYDDVDKKVIDPMRRRWNSTPEAFNHLAARFPDGAYHMRNAANILKNDVHVAARRYIREVLLARAESRTALMRMARLAARSISIDALSLQDIQPFCKQELSGKLGAAGSRRGDFGATICKAHTDPIHFLPEYNRMALETILAAVAHFDEC